MSRHRDNNTPAARARGNEKRKAMTQHMRARGWKRGPGGLWYPLPGWGRSDQ